MKAKVTKACGLASPCNKIAAPAAGLSLVIIFVLSASLAHALENTARHQMQIELFPDTQQLQVLDHITFEKSPHNPLAFKLSPRAQRIELKINGKLSNFIFENGKLRVDLPDNPHHQKIKISIGYRAVFDDPAPLRPLNADNPGYGVSATISPQGSFLLAGSGWYPQWDGGHSTYTLKVTAPSGMLAVTAGQSKGHLTQNGKTVSIWFVDEPVNGLSLSVGPYLVRQKKVGAITAATYFFPQTDHLADAYLDATVRFLSLYQDLFGPYPFEKFAVVENFFPTGYGFPSYTLIGGTVLRLPFIIHTSLGHEIAHCWWGNGVRVDYEAGNWSEALTTYVADYFTKEMKSVEDARAYRQQMLRNYATLVRPDQDFALHQFQSRYDPITKTIGYDKGAMVFHMLRRQVGDDAFWGALRDLYRKRLFKATSWIDIQAAFEARVKRSLQGFFDQWVFGKGAPRFYLDTVRAIRTGDTWTIEGHILQQDPEFSFDLDLTLQNREKSILKTIRVTDKQTRFKVVSDFRPLTLKADPDTDIFRRLLPDEIPPAINSLKNSPSLLVLLAENIEPDIERAARMLLRSLGVKNYTFSGENDLHQHDFREKDILLVGYPQQTELMITMPAQVAIKATSFTLNQNVYNRSSDIFFGVFPHPHHRDRVSALFLPLSASYAEEVARKVAHYGKYSYLAFQKGLNRDKGFWSLRQSALEYRWDDNNRDISQNFTFDQKHSVY